MIKLYIGLAIIAVLSGIGYKYNQMENQIELQIAQLINKEITISVMADNVVEVEKSTISATKKAVFDAITVEKKVKIEKELKYDKANSVDITSTRFYF